jgi:hypothetical protein
MSEGKNSSSDKDNKPNDGGEYDHKNSTYKVAASVVASSVVGGPAVAAVVGGGVIINEYRKWKDHEK